VAKDPAAAELGSQPAESQIFERVIWDFDGVLGDTRAISWRVAEEILGILGVNVAIDTQEVFREYMIRGGAVTPEETQILRDMHRLVMRSRAAEIVLFEAATLIERLAVPSEIVTSGLADVARIALKERAGRFTRIRGQECGSKEALLDGLTTAALFITDTTVDVRRARQRSIPTVAVSWGYDPANALQREEPTHLVHSPEALEALLRELKLLQ
jgi:phosphoglycolate phosphatase-like HAD superfamily hydrolase